MKLEEVFVGCCIAYAVIVLLYLRAIEKHLRK